MVFSIVILLRKYNFYLRNIFWYLSLKNSLGWDFVYFATCTCFLGTKQNLLFSYGFYTTVVNDGLHEPYLLLTNNLFILILSESHWGCLIWSNLSKFRSKNLKASLISFTRSLFSHKARCFNRSEHALYGNFILLYCYNSTRALIVCWADIIFLRWPGIMNFFSGSTALLSCE